MSDRLSRKEIKQGDAFTAGVGTAIEYVESNHRLIAAIFGGALVLGLFVAAVVMWLERRDVKINELLGRAIQVAEAPIDAANPKPDDQAAPSFASVEARRATAKALLTELADYGSDTADLAAIYLAQIALEEGDAARARELWTEFLEEHRGELPAAGVELSLLALDRSEGKGEEVIERLRESIGKPGNQLPDDVLLWELAVTLEQLGRDGEARETYQRLVDENPDSSYVNRARQKLVGQS